MLMKNVRHYFAEWKHPETRQWIRVHASVPSKNGESLVEMLDDDCRVFAILDTDFNRLYHLKPKWRAVFAGFHKLRLEPQGRDYIIHLADETVVGYDDVDELFYNWIVGQQFDIDWY